MKKKRGTIAVLLILALLILGIGYAVLSSTLTISGSATAVANDDNFEVVFADSADNAETTYAPSYNDDDVADTSYTGYSVTQTVDDGSTSATFSVENLTTEGDTVVLTFPIENRGIVDANIAVKTDASESITNSEYFSISTTLSASTVAVDEEVDAVVTVTCLQTPTDAEQSSGDVTITLEATAAE